MMITTVSILYLPFSNIVLAAPHSYFNYMG